MYNYKFLWTKGENKKIVRVRRDKCVTRIVIRSHARLRACVYTIIRAPGKRGLSDMVTSSVPNYHRLVFDVVYNNNNNNNRSYKYNGYMMSTELTVSVTTFIAYNTRASYVIMAFHFPSGRTKIRPYVVVITPTLTNTCTPTTVACSASSDRATSVVILRFNFQR